jgi:hypothetical protein
MKMGINLEASDKTSFNEECGQQSRHTVKVKANPKLDYTKLALQTWCFKILGSIYKRRECTLETYNIMPN